MEVMEMRGEGGGRQEEEGTGGAGKPRATSLRIFDTLCSQFCAAAQGKTRLLALSTLVSVTQGCRIHPRHAKQC